MHLSSNIGLFSRAKFIMGGLVILSAVEYLIFPSTKANAVCFITVDQLNARNRSLTGQNLRISGAVVGSTIQFNPDIHNLFFDITNVAGDYATIEAQGELAKV